MARILFLPSFWRNSFVYGNCFGICVSKTVFLEKIPPIFQTPEKQPHLLETNGVVFQMLRSMRQKPIIMHTALSICVT